MSDQTKCVSCDQVGDRHDMEENEHGAGYVCKQCAKEWNADNASNSLPPSRRDQARLGTSEFGLMNAGTCEKCGKPIELNRTTYDGKPYHTTCAIEIVKAKNELGYDSAAKSTTSTRMKELKQKFYRVNVLDGNVKNADDFIRGDRVTLKDGRKVWLENPLGGGRWKAGIADAAAFKPGAVDKFIEITEDMIKKQTFE